MNRFAFVVLCSLTVALGAQEPNPRFEVTSVKPGDSRQPFVMGFQGGRYSARSITLKRLIRLAYGSENWPLMEDHVAGGPDWLDTDRFDVEGTAPGTRDSRDYNLPAAVPLMLRQLLADRFSLKAHFEPRDRPVFALVVANRDGRFGPGLRRRTVDCIPPKVLPAPKTDDRTCYSEGSPVAGFASASGIAMPLFANILSQSIPEIDRKVVDRTGLTGTFDIELRWTPQSATPGVISEAKYPAIFTALEEQLGLRLERATASVEVLVVDSVERPTPN